MNINAAQCSTALWLCILKMQPSTGGVYWLSGSQDLTFEQLVPSTLSKAQLACGWASIICTALKAWHFERTKQCQYFHYLSKTRAFDASISHISTVTFLSLSVHNSCSGSLFLALLQMKQTGLSNKWILQNRSLCGRAEKTLLLPWHQGNTWMSPLPVITVTKSLAALGWFRCSISGQHSPKYV